jgi:hypothetical protein
LLDGEEKELLFLFYSTSFIIIANSFKKVKEEELFF